MSTIFQARQFMQQGNFAAARETVNSILRMDPNNAEAWQLSVDLAMDAPSRAQAQAGLQRALSMRPQPRPQPQPVPYQPQYPPQGQYSPYPIQQQPPGMNYPAPIYPPYGVPYEKDYIGEALITLLLYYVGAGVIGFIANLIFLNNAKNDQRRGVMTRNVGCLQAILIVNSIIFGLLFLSMCIFFMLPAMFGGY
jgi:hypothetical protein